MEDFYTPTNSMKPVLLGIIVDVSNSMQRNWKNTEGKPLPRIEVIRDALNRQIKKQQLVSKKPKTGGKRQTIDVFCIGMGFKAPMFWTDVELSNDQEHNLHNAKKRINAGLVCDLLALSEILPNDAELTEFKQKLDEKWSSHTKHIFDKATIKEDVYTQLKQYLQEELYRSSSEKLHKSVFYRFYTWVTTQAEGAENGSLLNKFSSLISDKIKSREEKNIKISQSAAATYFENIYKLAISNFIKNREKYLHLIKNHLDEFIKTYIRSALRALTLGFDIPELVDYLDGNKAIMLAEQIYQDIDVEVRRSIALVWLDNRKSLWLSKRSIGASLDKKMVKDLTERCIKKCGWSILRPLLQQTVLNMFVEQFETQAKEQLPYWITLASIREVNRSVRKISTMLPDVIGNHIYSEEVMFGTTPFREALDRAAIRLLDKTYKSREKVLIIISDGEFEEKQSAILSADLLRKRGVTIISCLVADRNIVTQLVKQFKGQESMGAKLMFAIASEVTKEGSLKIGKDHSSKDKKLFYQINTSQILEDVMDTIFKG
jgi:hypothetical protein